MSYPMWADPSTNAKTTLVEFCQRYCGKSMGKGDIAYTTNEYDSQFQSTVKLDCVEGQEFAGELCSSAKEAEQAAAKQALEGLKSEADSIAAQGRKKGGGKYGKGGQEPEIPPLNVKNKLREALKQFLGRDLTDGDMVYETSPAQGGHIARLKLPNLPGALGNRFFMGCVSPYKRDTMLVAAKAAVETMLADPNGQAIDLSKVPDDDSKKEPKKRKEGTSSSSSWGKSKGWGKGKGGKGWGFDPWEFMMMMMGPWAKGMGKGMGGTGGAGGKGSRGWDDSSSKKSSRPGGPNLPRTKIGGPYMGEVTAWKGKFGFISPSEPIDHPAAKKGDGKVYVSSKDVVGDELKVGSTVHFMVYSDSSGIGAEEVHSM
eukprot:CAMPEP_0197894618 /NCGR_PEP_ID=MMETSP1439-20131203/35924_1 /TAXON_ID=66791 /ORGANISM="Gonyaulax spinifera, Strain CCMP409" /LENGTH=370 /DNA_ID=CAMNT_0043514993 /DNA_START=66 /DNA_END=1178 /DNA_ORIENTATION=-